MELHSIIKLIPETYFFNQVTYELDVHQQIVANTIEKKKNVVMGEDHKGNIRKIHSEAVGLGKS